MHWKARQKRRGKHGCFKRECSTLTSKCQLRTSPSLAHRRHHSVYSAGLTLGEVLAATEGDDSTVHENNDASSAALSSQDDVSTISVSAVPEPRILSFAEMKELIQQGKTDQIPNNKIIPNDLSVRRI